MGGIGGRINAVEQARRDLIVSLSGITEAQATWQPEVDAWSIAQTVEHLVLAEHSGVSRMWEAAVSYQDNAAGWQGEAVHRGCSIEEIISITWRAHEEALTNCVPQSNGPLAYWLARFAACQPVLEALGQVLTDLDPTAVIAPHFLSGPLDADQRLQFLRWHIAHHRAQIMAISAADAARFATV